VNQVAEGEASYVKRGRKSLKNEFMKSRKWGFSLIPIFS
jgi:hypothetical protein